MFVAVSLALLAVVHEPLLDQPVALPIVSEAALATAAQGTLLESRPPFFVSVGWHYIDGEVKGPLGSDPESETGFSIDAGMVSWRENFGLALEGGVIVSSYDLQVDPLTEESVDATRFLFGVRLIDANWDNLLWHGRAGAMYRTDEGTVIDDSGFGWYAGGGVEWQLGAFSIGPQFLYADTGSVNSTEWIFGLNGTLGF